MLNINDAAVFLGVSKTTLRRWDHLGILSAYRTPGGHRRYKLCDLDCVFGISTNCNPPKTQILCYARVSGHKQKQKGDLERQVENLKTESIKQGEESPIVITDVGSGLNPNRSGLKKVFRLVKMGNITKILITFQDRLTRFGFLYIQYYCDLFGVRIIEINQKTKKSVQEGLVDDMMALIACFSGKLYGMRSAKTRKKRSLIKISQKYIDRVIRQENQFILHALLQNFSTEQFIKLNVCNL